MLMDAVGSAPHVMATRGLEWDAQKASRLGESHREDRGGAAMHELGITQGIVDRARETAMANGAIRVTDLFVAMTPAADFAQDSIEMYFEMLTGDDDFFRGAKLHFDHRSITARCLECGEEFTVSARHEQCPRCSSVAVTLDPDALMVQLTDIGIDGAEEELSGGA